MTSGITVVDLHPLDDSITQWKKFFPKVLFIRWNMQEEERPELWRQQLWRGFGCGLNFGVVLIISSYYFRWKVAVDQASYNHFGASNTQKNNTFDAVKFKANNICAKDSNHAK